MTFRPSDDVLEQMADGQNSQAGSSQYYTYNNGYDTYSNAANQGVGQQNFDNGGMDNYGVMGEEGTIPIIDLPVEEVKAPDLSDLILNSGVSEINIDDQPKTNVDSQGETNADSQKEVNIESQVDTSMNQNLSNPIDNTQNLNVNGGVGVNNPTMGTPEIAPVAVQTVEQPQTVIPNAVPTQENLVDYVDLLDSDKITDIERSKLVSSIEGSINGNLDFLVDNNRLMAIEKYKKIHRFLYRRGLFVFITIVGMLLGTLLEARANNVVEHEYVRETSIQNIDDWKNNTTNQILLQLINKGIDIKVDIPYGYVSTNGNKFQTNSNLLLYKGIVIPQIASIDYNAEDFISLEKFDNHENTRQDIETLIKYLITDRNNINLNSISNDNWTGNVFQGSLIDGFNLVCLNNFKVSDIVCDKYIGSFNKYGKYYNLSYYAEDLLSIVKMLKSQKKSISGVCSMIIDYTQHSGIVSSDILKSIMEGCDDESKAYYKRLINFITIDNSLGQPVLSDEVFEDPNLNAYKLLSSQQIVYKFLDGSSLNENYIKSYLDFAQNVLNKDNGKNRYIAPIYKDILYLFNNDIVYQNLLNKGKLSSEIKQKIDQINNGNLLYKYPSLLSQLTTPNLENQNLDFTGSEIEEQTIEDLFSKFYSMNDRLKIRKVVNISGDNLRVQTELFTNKILSVTDGKTLKLTVLLYRNGNTLYVNNIKVANQPNFSEILNIYAGNGRISFNDMLSYIDEQIGMRYQDPSELEEENPTLCEQIQEREDISIYSCDESSIALYKGETEYNFTLINGVLDSFNISDEDLEASIKGNLKGTLFTRENTPTVIISIIDFTVELEGDNNIQKKLDLIDQFRIHFKIIPDDIHDIDGESDEFLVDLTLGDIKIQAHYNVESHLLTKISYINCDNMLEIRGLTISVTTENEPQLVEIMNNPRVFLTKFNPAAYRKYQRMCNEEVGEKKQ